MLKSKLLLCIFGLFCLSSTLEASQLIYKWKDSKGNIQYTQSKPSQGIEYSVIRYRTNGSNKSSSKVNVSNSKQTTAKQSDAIAKHIAEQKKITEQNANIDQRNCEISKANLEVLERNPRIQVKEDGETRLLDEQERAGRIEVAKENINKYCK